MAVTLCSDRDSGRVRRLSLHPDYSLGLGLTIARPSLCYGRRMAEETTGGRRTALLVGLVAGVAVVALSSLILLVIGLVPSSAVWGFFGSGGHGPHAWRASRALLSPWNGASYASFREGGTRELQRRTEASLGAVLVLFAVLAVAGFVVRRTVSRSLRLRTFTLLATSLTVAALVALAAALLSYSTAAIQPPGGGSGYYIPATHHYFGVVSFFVAALVSTLLLGAFTFDVVRLLPQPFGDALRRAGALVGICFVAFGLLFPVFVVSDGLPTANVARDFGYASNWATAVGGFALPLALQTPISTEQLSSGGPFINTHAFSPNAPGHLPPLHWQKLAISTGLDHPNGLLFRHAASLGVWGSFVGVVITGAIVAALAWVTVGLCRRSGASSPNGVLRLGLLQGACVALVLVPTCLVTSFSAGVGRPFDHWRVLPLGLVYTIVFLIVACVLSALVYAQFGRRRMSAPTEGIVGII
jgi:hypothetical protein